MGDLNFGAEVLWVSRVKLPAKWGTKPHHHEFYHFTYVVSGSGVWKVDGEEFRASAGDCINVPPHIAHNMELDDAPARSSRSNTPFRNPPLPVRSGRMKKCSPATC